MIEIHDSVERQVVATGNALIALPGVDNIGVRNCHNEPDQRLQTDYSYLLVNTATDHSISAECTALPGGGMQTASFHRN
ncbi:hypothetical protein VSX64_19825 [Aurantimonas sp. C2-6-R+9]|uniref:hypothetical protein n=1 Tax=unclassified Aurantimonas TaxID=2638230 RepID=UPI002E184026|nr:MULTISPECIES: hypothetical protein [unclassified Aurantimonas]MEC5293557.1 hypothetical protein [Aurantimonas sp. C2-3-R2]MEC5383081.1 hypothetical protein [Aurantimonas sp. C2-6-R+9]MEC5414628.1 hypothetical protein [Aurantimonas sp. C2-4-R8]